MADLALIRNAADLYEEDFFLWTQVQARLLRERRFDELDLDNLVDEVDSVGRSERREIRNRMVVLIAHLLKWTIQPGRRTSSWQNTIREQRRELADVIEESPSLRVYSTEVFSRAYESGRLKAAIETGLDANLFPDQPPFTIEEALEDGFLPKETGLYDQS